MLPRMVRIISLTTPFARVRHLKVSLPLIPVLLDDVRYCRPGAPPAADEKPIAEPRQLSAPRPTFKDWAELGARTKGVRGDDKPALAEPG